MLFNSSQCQKLKENVGLRERGSSCDDDEEEYVPKSCSNSMDVSSDEDEEYVPKRRTRSSAKKRKLNDGDDDWIRMEVIERMQTAVSVIVYERTYYQIISHVVDWLEYNLNWNICWYYTVQYAAV